MHQKPTILTKEKKMQKKKIRKKNSKKSMLNVKH